MISYERCRQLSVLIVSVLQILAIFNERIMSMWLNRSLVSVVGGWKYEFRVAKNGW